MSPGHRSLEHHCQTAAASLAAGTVWLSCRGLQPPAAVCYLQSTKQTILLSYGQPSPTAAVMPVQGPNNK